MADDTNFANMAFRSLISTLNISTLTRNILQCKLRNTVAANLSTSVVRAIKQSTFLCFISLFVFIDGRNRRALNHSISLCFLITVAHTETDNTIIIEGQYLSSDRVDKLIRVDEDHNPETCFMCKLNLDVKHTVQSYLDVYL